MTEAGKQFEDIFEKHHNPKDIQKKRMLEIRKKKREEAKKEHGI